MRVARRRQVVGLLAPAGSGQRRLPGIVLRRLRDHAVAAFALGAIKRVVGTLHDVADILGLDLERRQSDRGGDVDSLVPL